MPKVTIWRDGAIETEFDPGHRDWRIGRSETNDITLADPRKSVSRFHAELREEHGRWVFIDLNSQNGSWKDGQRVNRLTLEHGHELLFGDYKLAFHDPTPVAPAPPPRAPRTAGTVGARASTAAPAPDQALLTPGATAGAAPVSAAPPPAVPPSVTPKPPRRGLNPIILVAFVLALLAAGGAVAYRVLTSSDDTPAPAPASTPTTEARPAPPSGGPARPTDAPATVTLGAEPASTPAGPEAPTQGTAATPPGTPVSQAPGVRAARTPSTTPAAPKGSPALASRYDAGRRALEAGRFVDAERAFQAVLAQRPDFRDTTALLAQARQGQVLARDKAVADAQALEGAGDWVRAVAAYERAGAADRAAAARVKMHAAGDDAYRKARQFDARNRPGEAITWYGRAVEWLADTDTRKGTAQERLSALKGGKE